MACLRARGIPSSSASLAFAAHFVQWLQHAWQAGTVDAIAGVIH